MDYNIRSGTYRTVSLDDNTAVIVQTDGQFTELQQLIRVSNSVGSMMQVDNCAILLAMCLNAEMDVTSLHEALLHYRAGPPVGGWEIGIEAGGNVP